MIRDPSIDRQVTAMTELVAHANQRRSVAPAFIDSWNHWAGLYQQRKNSPAPQDEAAIRSKLSGWTKIFSEQFGVPVAGAGADTPIRTANGVTWRKPANYGAPSSAPATRIPPASLTQLAPGEGLTAGPGGPGTGSALQSPSGQFVLQMRADGNLSLVDTVHNRELWFAGTFKAGNLPAQGALFTLQNDGNVTIYDTTGRPMWSLNTNGKGAVVFRVQDDGNLSLNDAANKEIWSSNTWQQAPNIIAAPTAQPTPAAPIPTPFQQPTPAAAPVAAPTPFTQPVPAAPVTPPAYATPPPSYAPPAPSAAPVATPAPYTPPAYATPPPSYAPPAPSAAPVATPAPYTPPIFVSLQPTEPVQLRTLRQEIGDLPVPAKVVGVLAGVWIIGDLLTGKGRKRIRL